MRLRIVFVIGFALTAASCTRPSRGRADADSSDASFLALQARGKMAMGVDQNASTHRFEALPDGGRLALLMNTDDTLGVAQIRAHLRLIQHAFEAGDFSTPEFVHMRKMPGTAVMAARRDRIRYAFHALPRGGEVRITTSDSAALAAVHAFMGAQQMDHHASGPSLAAEPVVT